MHLYKVVNSQKYMGGQNLFVKFREEMILLFMIFSMKIPK